MPDNDQINQEMRQCIQNCLDCHRTCTETAIHCLQMGGKHAEVSHLKLVLDCAQICGTSADFMIRMSRFHPNVCGVCAEVCRACGEACRRMAEGDATMQECAEACLRCTQSCEQMAGAAAAA